MMPIRVARFKKVSFEQFSEDTKDEFGLRWTDEELKAMYCKLDLPRRATTGSAGYDFFTPFNFVLKPGQTIKVPTGIRCFIDDGWWLGILPRSGHGFKYRLRMNNTLCVIDSDYSGSDNEGHILIKLSNEGESTLSINAATHESPADGFAQGVLLPYGITLDDDVRGIRNGGFGSTNHG